MGLKKNKSGSVKDFPPCPNSRYNRQYKFLNLSLNQLPASLIPHLLNHHTNLSGTIPPGSQLPARGDEDPDINAGSNILYIHLEI